MTLQEQNDMLREAVAQADRAIERMKDAIKVVQSSQPDCETFCFSGKPIRFFSEKFTKPSQ